MIVDCGTCSVRGAACADCVVTFLTIPVRAEPGAPPGPSGPPGGGVGGATAAVDLDAAERDAIDVLARSGLVPPLRLVRAV